MKNIFIHIGPHKTGTTTVQNALFVNQEMLQARKILVPKSGRRNVHNGAQHNLAWELLNAKKYRPGYGRWEDLKLEIESSGAQQVILSSEEFSRLDRAAIAKIKDILCDYHVNIISYVRGQEKLMQSFWTQMLKSGNQKKFVDDFDVWLEKNDYYYANADYSALLGKWKAVFGIENMLVRVLERDQLDGSLFHDFLSACNITFEKNYEDPENKNISPGIKILVLAQALKKKLVGDISPADREKLFVVMGNYARSHGWNKNKVNLVDAQLYQKIMGRYQESNRTIAREYFDREELFLESFREKEITRFDLADFQPTELLDLFAFTIGKMLAKKEVKMKRGELEREYQRVKEELDNIYASRGWRLLQRLRLIKRKLLGGGKK